MTDLGFAPSPISEATISALKDYKAKIDGFVEEIKATQVNLNTNAITATSARFELTQVETQVKKVLKDFDLDPYRATELLKTGKEEGERLEKTVPRQLENLLKEVEEILSDIHSKYGDGDSASSSASEATPEDSGSKKYVREKRLGHYIPHASVKPKNVRVNRAQDDSKTTVGSMDGVAICNPEVEALEQRIADLEAELIQVRADLETERASRRTADADRHQNLVGHLFTSDFEYKGCQGTYLKGCGGTLNTKEKEGLLRLSIKAGVEIVTLGFVVAVVAVGTPHYFAKGLIRNYREGVEL